MTLAQYHTRTTICIAAIMFGLAVAGHWAGVSIACVTGLLCKRYMPGLLLRFLIWRMG